MKKIISLALICFMLFSTNATMYVNAESTESKLKANQVEQEELDKKINNLNGKINNVEEKIKSDNEKIEKLSEE